MAQQENQVDRETFCCSICLELLKEPVAIPCGHSYCLSCIRKHWDAEKLKGIYSCPLCMTTFALRPVLQKNIMLADLVEKLKKTQLQAAAADHGHAGAADVACDFCTEKRLKAVRSCLNCLASYCEKHLQPHYDVAPLKKHKLVEPYEKLQENICSRHDEVMKIFCRTDQCCICCLCSLDEHKGHDTVSAAAERTERQRELETTRQNIQQRLKDKGTDVKQLQQEEKAINGSADEAVEQSEKILTDLIGLLQNKTSDLKQQIRSQQETEVGRVRDLREKLEQEITELKRKDAKLQQLANTQDHTHFLRSYPSLSTLGESTNTLSVTARPLRYFEDLTAVVSQFRGLLQDLLTETWSNILRVANQLDVLLSKPEPETREDFLKYSQDIVMDQKTAHKWLILSNGNKKVKCVREKQSYSDNPDRFTNWAQVLSKESLTGRCYWEVEISGGQVRVAVAYKNIKRAGGSSECGFGNNEHSWVLNCYGDSCKFYHNSSETKVSGPQSSKVGVYLDHRAGTLSFYSLSDTMTLLHRVQTTFTQPLYAGLYLCYDSIATFL